MSRACVWLQWIHGSIRIFRCTRFHSNSPSCCSLSIILAASFFLSPSMPISFLYLSISLSDLSLYLFKVYINTYLFFFLSFSPSLAFYLLLRIIDVQPLEGLVFIGRERKREKERAREIFSLCVCISLSWEKEEEMANANESRCFLTNRNSTTKNESEARERQREEPKLHTINFFTKSFIVWFAESNCWKVIIDVNKISGN